MYAPGFQVAHPHVRRVHVRDLVAVEELGGRAVPVADPPERGGGARVAGDGDVLERRGAPRRDGRAAGVDGQLVLVDRHRVGAGQHPGAGEGAVAGAGVVQYWAVLLEKPTV